MNNLHFHPSFFITFNHPLNPSFDSEIRDFHYPEIHKKPTLIYRVWCIDEEQHEVSGTNQKMNFFNEDQSTYKKIP